MTEAFKQVFYNLGKLSADVDSKTGNKYDYLINPTNDLVTVFEEDHEEDMGKADDYATSLATIMLKYPNLTDEEFLLCWNTANRIFYKRYMESVTGIRILETH